jgi:hypothetical protein
MSLLSVVQQICVLSQLRGLLDRSFLAMRAVVVMRHNLASRVMGPPHTVISSRGPFHQSYNT